MGVHLHQMQMRDGAEDEGLEVERMSDWKGTEYERGLFMGQSLVISDALGNMYQFCNRDNLCILDEVLGALELFTINTAAFGSSLTLLKDIIADLHTLRAKVYKAREEEE